MTTIVRATGCAGQSGWPSMTSDALQGLGLDRTGGVDVSRVARRRWLKQQRMCFVHRHRLVLHASWDDEELALLELHHGIAKMDVETPLQGEEQLVLALVTMPDTLALELDDLDISPVEFPTIFGAQCSSNAASFSGVCTILPK